MPKPAKKVPTSMEKTVASAAEQLLRRALEARDRQWMLAVEDFRRSWEKKLNKLMNQLDGELHTVPFMTPPPIEIIEFVVSLKPKEPKSRKVAKR